MTRADLTHYTGKHVRLILEGKSTSSALLNAENPAEAFITIPKLYPEWTTQSRYILTDEDVASLSPDSSGGLIGKIYLKRDGDALIWDHSNPSAK